jgi:hypothetical protein
VHFLRILSYAASPESDDFRLKVNQAFPDGALRLRLDVRLFQSILGQLLLDYEETKSLQIIAIVSGHFIPEDTTVGDRRHCISLPQPSDHGLLPLFVL